MFYLFDKTSGGFYTGRAGDGWVAADRSEAFGYEGKGEAERKAALFNRNRILHGKIFEVVSENN